MTEKEKEAPPLEPTNASAWPSKDKATGIVIELPSGAVARISRPPLQYYIATGRIPPKLWAKVQKEGAELFSDPVNTMTKEEMRLFVDWMISCAFVEPIVSMARKAGTIYVGDLDERDKDEVMSLLGLSLAG